MKLDSKFFELNFRDKMEFCIEFCTRHHKETHGYKPRRIVLGGYYMYRLRHQFILIECHEFILPDVEYPVVMEEGKLYYKPVKIFEPISQVTTKNSLFGLIVEEDEHDYFALDIY